MEEEYVPRKGRYPLFVPKEQAQELLDNKIAGAIDELFYEDIDGIAVEHDGVWMDFTKEWLRKMIDQGETRLMTIEMAIEKFRTHANFINVESCGNRLEPAQSEVKKCELITGNHATFYEQLHELTKLGYTARELSTCFSESARCVIYSCLMDKN